MNLGDWQKAFVAALTKGDTPASIDVRGMAVHVHNYRSQLVACLRDTYAKTVLWLGDDTFDAHAAGYVERHPPSSWTLGSRGMRGWPSVAFTDSGRRPVSAVSAASSTTETPRPPASTTPASRSRSS